MNFQISRIRLVSVGPDPARYDPLELDLRKPDHAGPSDTVLFLPNTGGKTVLMRLLFSVLHPPIVERIGTEETTQRQKNLLGYVLEHDTSHVVVEWRRVEDGRFVDGNVLITGLVAEWRGGRPTGKPEDLARLWYSIRGPADLIGVDRIAFDIEVVTDGGSARRRLPLRRFREQLEELKKSTSQTPLELSTTEVQRDWIDHLDKLGLDRALFRYQGEMNHNEAGASAIARFKEDRDFIKFFLDAVFDPGELAALDREFAEVADKVSRFPEFERRLRFELAAVGELEPLVHVVAALAVARGEAQTARRTALDLLAAFASAQSIAHAREQRERQRSREQDTESRRLTVHADRMRDEWREFRRIGATLWLNEATAAYEAAAAQTAKAELDVRAWALTEDLARLQDASAKVAALDEAYATELERLRPLQTARDEAAARLSDHLAAKAVLAWNEASLARARAHLEKERAAAARTDERDAYVEAAKLDATRDAHERRCDEVAALRQRLVSNGVLETNEPTADAHVRETDLAASTQERIEHVEEQMSALEAERGRLDAEDVLARGFITELSQSLARVAGPIDSAQKERRELSDNRLVLELAETSSFDLELVGPAIAERLLGRAKEADATRLDVELLGVDDRRAIRGLDETGFLPPPIEVEAALARLTAAGITGATPGTRYVAEAVASTRRAAVLASRPDLVGGVILTESADLGRARAVLEAASLDPTMIITVGTASSLVAAEDQPAQADVFVVSPAEAVWDREAAGAERDRRGTRLGTLDEQRDILDDRARACRSLAEALIRHAAAYPAGWLAGRLTERDGLTADLSRQRELCEAHDRRRERIAELLSDYRTELGDLRRISREAEQRLAQLQRLLDEENAIAGLPATVERLQAEAKSWRMLAGESARAASKADEQAEVEAELAQNQLTARERIQEELATIIRSEATPEPSLEDARRIVESREDIFELRARFAEFDRRLAGETSASDVAARRQAAIRARDELSATITSHPVKVRERAAVLLALPEAGKLAGRRAAAERANSDVARARIAERDTYAEQNTAKTDLTVIEDEIRSSRRSAKIAEERAPRDRYHAARLAAEARQKADTTQAQVAEAERQRNAAREDADVAKKLADALGVLATQLRMGLKIADDATLPDVPPFDGDAEEANRVGLATSLRLTKAIDAERGAEENWRGRDSALRAVLAREEFSDLAAFDRLYRRLAQSQADTLARDAAELVLELRTSIGVLQTELATLEEDRKLATTSLAKSVHKALSNLRLAESRSKMPARLRDWSGESFLEIRFEKPPSEELDVRLRTFVIQVLDPKAERPTGSKLLMLALERAVGQFRVRILKPNEAFAPIRVPIAELSSPTFSNGQRATVATAMMLMLSELRRQSRSAARDASVGTLLLDNPLGNANAGFLIDVQRTVAAAAGIQLVYTTGIADLNALRRFPNVIALSNDAARRTMRRYVRANAELLELLIPSQDGSGGRLSAQRVVAIKGHEAIGS